MEWWNIAPNLKTWNGRIHVYPQILKHGMAEYTPKYRIIQRQRMQKYTMLLLFEQVTHCDVVFKFSPLHLKLFSRCQASGSQHICA